MGSILSPPFAFDGESLGKRKNEWIWNFLGKTGEEMQTCLNGMVKRLLNLHYSLLKMLLLFRCPFIHIQDSKAAVFEIPSYS